MSSQPSHTQPFTARFRLGKVARLLLTVSLCLILQACKVELYTNLSESEANDMLAVILEHGLDGQKVAGADGSSYSIHIEESQLAQAVQLLRSYGLPRQTYEGLEQYQQSGGLIKSPTEERARLVHALSQEVAKTLSQIDGVVTARVHLVLPERNPFAEQVTPPSASVFIKHRPDISLNNIKSEIKMIVEKSIEGLTYDRIAVVMLPTQTLRQQATLNPVTPLPANLRNNQSASSGISWLLITGIVVVVLGLILSIVFLLVMMKRQKKAFAQGSSQAVAPQSSAPVASLESRRDAASG
ncbi:MAG: type III secretion system inner membrane ring lipoprotein SctJ [Candidatus Competibacterales bacterium]